MPTPILQQKGFLLVELVVTIAVLVVIISSILTLYQFVFNAENREQSKLQARLYAQEGLEAIEFAGRFDWNQMQDGEWHPELVGGAWKLLPGAELLEFTYTRSITIAAVERLQSSNGHAFDDIVVSGGTDDPETKLVTVTVSWNTGPLGAQSVSYQMYQARDWPQSDP